MVILIIQWIKIGCYTMFRSCATFTQPHRAVRLGTFCNAGLQSSLQRTASKKEQMKCPKFVLIPNALAQIAVKILFFFLQKEKIVTHSWKKLQITSLILYFHRSSVNVVCHVFRNDNHTLNLFNKTITK